MGSRAAKLSLLVSSLVVAVTAGACSPAPYKVVAQAPIPPGPDTPATATAPGALPAKSAFAALADRLLDQWLAGDPSLGRTLGLHQYDGKVPDFDAKAIGARIATATRMKAELATVSKSGLSADDALDLAILDKQLELYLFHMNDLAEWRTRPAFYEELWSVNAYLDRDYAPLAGRAEKLLAHEKAALAQVDNVRKNLVSPMPKPVVETAIKIYKGYVEYLRGDVVKQLEGVGDAAFQADFKATNERLAGEADKLAKYLHDVELPKGDGSYVLGVQNFKKLLSAQEGLDISLAEFKKMGEANLLANKKLYEKLAKTVKLTRPKKEALLDEATRMMEASRRFIVDKKIVTIPSEDKAVVKETPPFMRWNAAFLNDAGPFEAKGMAAFYYITKPDPTWPKKEQEEYLAPLGILLATTVHEVYPGHFLQGQWLRKAPTRTQKTFGSYSFIEGWAHYVEQMTIDEGFGADDPQNRLGQVSDALLRNCRFVVSLGLHTEGMTLAQAEKRFIGDCKQDKATAREQAIRGTFDPGYFAYTLGKIQILALREEAKKKLGDKFSLQRFHDALLSHGSPPVRLIHDRVLEQVAGP